MKRLAMLDAGSLFVLEPVESMPKTGQMFFVVVSTGDELEIEPVYYSEEDKMFVRPEIIMEGNHPDRVVVEPEMVGGWFHWPTVIGVKEVESSMVRVETQVHPSNGCEDCPEKEGCDERERLH